MFELRNIRSYLLIFCAVLTACGGGNGETSKNREAVFFSVENIGKDFFSIGASPMGFSYFLPPSIWVGYPEFGSVNLGGNVSIPTEAMAPFGKRYIAYKTGEAGIKHAELTLFGQETIVSELQQPLWSFGQGGLGFAFDLPPSYLSASFPNCGDGQNLYPSVLKVIDQYDYVHTIGFEVCPLEGTFKTLATVFDPGF